jgi:hypothetical protein
MEITIKVIEFSSDVFSKSTQLKDIIISPLFSNTSFSINIFDAISKNEEYTIKANTQIIKIGLFNGKSLLGIGEININKKMQKIKISSEDKNKNKKKENIYNKVQDNDYYLTIECNNSIPSNNKTQTINTREINHHKKKKNASMDYSKNTNNGNYLYNKNKKKIKEKHSKFNLFLKNLNNYEKNVKNNNKIYSSRDNINSNNNKPNTIVYNNNLEDEPNKIKSNSTIIKSDNNSILKKKLMASGDDPRGDNNKNNNENNKTNINDNINDKFNENDNNDNNVKDNEVNIFNLSFKKELFSDGVLILSDDNIGGDGEENSNLNQFKNIDISDFDGLVNDFDLIYNNVSNNNVFSDINIKDNFLLEYQYFLEKTSDIFHLYSKLSKEINNQNLDIQKYIKNYNSKIKVMLKKDKILRIKKQNIDIAELFGQNNYQENKKYYEDEIINIKNKFSLIQNINNDILYFIKTDNNKKEKIHSLLTDIFKNIINNENNYVYLKDKMNIINLILNKNRNSNNTKAIPINGGNNYEDNNENDNESKIDLEALKNKIDKLKNQYINEAGTKDHENKTYGSYGKKIKKGKKMFNNSNPNFSNKKKKIDKDKKMNMFTPSGDQRNKITNNYYLDNQI